ncbi:MAG: hypothetical protein N3E51_00675 [Candidatus Micrarchaeota archaeon]|nr:hypothetical protein [Candidatus Micrarchaeota archaeon]
MEETTTTDEPEPPSMIRQAIEIIREAAGGQRVLVIRLAVGVGRISKVEIAKAMHAAFPNASVEINDGGEEGSLTVKEIEVA